MTYEEMQKSHNDLNIVELDLSEVSGLKGFYYAGNIAIEKKLSSIEKSCVLAEELGHHYTSYGSGYCSEQKTGTPCPSPRI